MIKNYQILLQKKWKIKCHTKLIRQAVGSKQLGCISVFRFLNSLPLVLTNGKRKCNQIGFSRTQKNQFWLKPSGFLLFLPSVKTDGNENLPLAKN